MEKLLSLPFFEDRHRLLFDQLGEWLVRNCPKIDHSNPDKACEAIRIALGEAGFLTHAATLDTAAKLDVRSLCIIREVLAQHDSLADFTFAMQGLGSGPISLFGNQTQKERYLPGVVAGRKACAFALSEPDAGSDVRAMGIRAIPDGEEYVLDGTKTWISNAGIADFYVVFAKLSGVPGAEGKFGAFVVEADNPGLKIERDIDLIAPHPIGTIHMNNCRVPRHAVVGDLTSGMRVALGTLSVFRSSVGAAANGFARRAMHEAISWARKRPMYGGYLSDLQVTRAEIVEMAVRIESSALLIYSAAWQADKAGVVTSVAPAMAKLTATENAQKTIDASLQIHGGAGVRKGTQIERLYREIRALRIYEGATEVQRDIISKHIIESVSDI